MSSQMQGNGAQAVSTAWQDRLAAACRSENLRSPTYQEYSDRRGGRTAWSCHVIVDGRQFAARNWYDGQFINNAKEDAAEVALTYLVQQHEQQQIPTASTQDDQQTSPS